MKLQKLGGYAAIASVCMPFCVLFLSTNRYSGYPLNNDPVKWMAAIEAVPTDFLTIGLLLIILSILSLITYLALHERMQAHAPLLTRLMLIAASAFTVMLIMYVMIFSEGNRIITPTHDVSAYRALIAITAGPLKTAGLLAACACLFAGCAVLKTRSLSRVLGWLYLLTGILWMLHFMISLIAIHFVFLAVANVWIGIALLRQKQPQPAAKEMAEP